MYSPTISIRITDADTRGWDPGPESRGETRTQNTHREKLRQEGLQPVQNKLLHFSMGQAVVPSTDMSYSGTTTLQGLKYLRRKGVA